MGYGLEDIKPQQLLISDTLDLPRNAYAFEIPRRASKTTSIFWKLLGRCATRPGYFVTFTAQSGLAGSAAFLEWVRELDEATPPDDLDLPPWLRNRARTKTAKEQRHLSLFGEELEVDEREHLTGGRGFRVMKGEVNKGIYFDNGSKFVVVRPDPKAFRGKAADVSWIDEAQEIDPLVGAELLAAIRPLQDTRPGASIILSGTAGEARAGIFWDYLERGRKGDPKVGIIDYCAPEDTPWELIENRASAMQLVKATHPGIGTLTTLPVMEDRWEELPHPQWAREYLSIWPEAFGTRAIAADLWEACAITKKPTIPVRVAFGISIKPGGGSAAIAAAWRTTTGLAHVEIVEHRSGTKWIPARMQDLTRKHRGSTIAFDDIGEGKATATEAEMLTPKPRLRMQTYRETAAGCVQFMRDLERGTLRHRHDVGLDAAVTAAGRRETRGDQGVWLWTPAEPGADITPLDAATRALRNWDQHYSRRRETSSGPIMGD